MTTTHLSSTALHLELEALSGKKLNLRLNQNHSTVLSVRAGGAALRVSLHQMFLEAPSHVKQAVARFIQGRRREANPTIQAYVEQNRSRMDRSKQLDPRKLQQEGRVYDLQQIYHEVNEIYFDSKLSLAITWYGTPGRRKRSHVTFGQFNDSLQLVKMHRILDNPFVPRYFVAYVMYHEMLHHVWPVVVKKNGRQVIHGPEFKAQEKMFHQYEEAEGWLKRNREKIFSGRI